MSYVKWLDASNAFVVPDEVYIFGAGFGTDDTVQWLSDNEKANVTLIESDRQNYINLLRRFNDKHPNWKLHNICVENGSDCNVFYRSSINQESGLMNVNHLKDLWQNIELLESYDINPVPFEDFFKNDKESSSIWVIINYFCSIEALRKIPENVLLLSVRVNKSEIVPAGFSEIEWSNKLKECGYKILTKGIETHPKIENWLCVKDSALMLQDMNNICNQKDEELKKLTERLRKKEKALELANNEIKLLESRINKESAKLTDSEIKKRIVELKECQQKTNELINDLKEINGIHKLCFEKIDNNMRGEFMMQEKLIKNTVNALGQHITKMHKKTSNNN